MIPSHSVSGAAPVAQTAMFITIIVIELSIEPTSPEPGLKAHQTRIMHHKQEMRMGKGADVAFCYCQFKMIC